MLQIVDSDLGFFVISGDHAWPAGMDSLSLGDALNALQCAEDDGSTPFDGAIVPHVAETVMRLRGARVVGTSA